MGQLSSISLKLLAQQKTASKNHSKNLAGLKKFAENDAFNSDINKNQLESSLDKLAQAAKTINPYEA